MKQLRDQERQAIHKAAAMLGRLGGRIGGKATTPAKQEAARKNGRLSKGRPPKRWNQLTKAGKYARKRREQSRKENAERR